MGFDECNTLVRDMLLDTLVAQGQAALGRLPAAERRGHVLLLSMGALLWHLGKPEEAIPLLEEALQGRREALGDHHPDTLQSIDLLTNVRNDLPC